MRTLYLEHANITVNNLQRGIDFFKAAFPDFEIRGEGVFNGRKWVHLGNQETYLAINQSPETESREKDYTSSGINHIGFVVRSVGELAERLLKAGFKRDYPKQVEDSEYEITLRMMTVMNTNSLSTYQRLIRKEISINS